MPEIVYEERTTDGTPLPGFYPNWISAAPVSIDAGDILIQFFCPEVFSNNTSGPPTIGFDVDIEGIERSLAMFLGPGQHSPAYSEVDYTIATAGSYTFSVTMRVGSTAQAFAAFPLAPAYLRVIADPYPVAPTGGLGLYGTFTMRGSSSGTVE